SRSMRRPRRAGRRRRARGPALELEPECGQLGLERRLHRLDDGLAHGAPQGALELEALLAPAALGPGVLDLLDARRVPVAVEVRLEPLFAPIARVDLAHLASTASSASCCLRIRRPR